MGEVNHIQPVAYIYCLTIYAYFMMGTQVINPKLHISEVSIPDQSFTTYVQISMVFVLLMPNLQTLKWQKWFKNSQTHYIIIFCDVCVCCPFPLSFKTLHLSPKTRYLSSSTSKQSSWACNELSSRTTLRCNRYPYACLLLAHLKNFWSITQQPYVLDVWTWNFNGRYM